MGEETHTAKGDPRTDYHQHTHTHTHASAFKNAPQLYEGALLASEVCMSVCVLRCVLDILNCVAVICLMYAHAVRRTIAVRSRAL